MEGLTIYSAHISYPYREESGQMVETSLTSDFVAKDDAQAVKDAFRHADNRVKALGGEKAGFYKEMCVGCVKVYTRYIGPFDRKGNSTTRNGFPFFEWKYDWPGTREQYIESAIAKMSGG